MPSRIQGRVRLRKILKILPAKTRAEIQKAVILGAEGMAQTMRNLAPIHIGNLKRSILVTPGNEAPNLYRRWKSRKIEADPALAAVIHTEEFYAPFVEFGTAPHVNAGEFPGTENPGIKAEPFWFPGYRARRKDVQAKINRAARKGIKDAFNGQPQD